MCWRSSAISRARSVRCSSVGAGCEEVLTLGVCSCPFVVRGSRHHPREIQRLVFVAIRRSRRLPREIAGDRQAPSPTAVAAQHADRRLRPRAEAWRPRLGVAEASACSWEESCVMPCWASVSMSSLAAASHHLPRGRSVRSNHEISCAVLARVAAYSAGAVSTASAAASAIATVVSAAPLLIKAPGMTADTPSPT